MFHQGISLFSFSRNNRLILMKTDHFVAIAKLRLSAKGTKCVPEYLNQTLCYALQKAHCSTGAEFRKFTEAESVSRTKGHSYRKTQGCTNLHSYNCSYQRKSNYFPLGIEESRNLISYPSPKLNLGQTVFDQHALDSRVVIRVARQIANNN